MQTKTRVRAVSRRLIQGLAGVGLAIAVPQLFHFIGLAAGVDGAIGAMLLPMHLVVMLTGALFGPVAGLVAGVFSPILSAGITGMPAMTAVPFMTVELAAYGLCAGLLKNVKMPTVIKVLLTQVAGRLVKLAVLAVCALAEVKGADPMSVWTATTAGLIGIVLQLALIPLIVYYFNNNRKLRGA